MQRFDDEQTGTRESSPRFFVFTGGPGSGKSTLLRALSERGFAHTPEAGRAIIQDQIAIGGEALPWLDCAAFAEQMLSWELRSYREAITRQKPVFFDRAIPDVVGYLRSCGLPIPQHLENAAKRFRYNTRVFIAPPWQAIYTQDEERRQSFDEAVATHRMMEITYLALGYELVPLPLDTVEARIEFVLRRIFE